MSPNPHSIPELKSFRLMKFFNSKTDKGLAFVKVKSLDEKLCKKLQKVRSRYFLATAECYYNSESDMQNIIKYSKYFDFHIVSCERIRKAITDSVPSAKCFIMGAGEFMTDPEIFQIQNFSMRKYDFVASANSFWTVKNFHKILEMQKHLLDHGCMTHSRIICGSIKDIDYYEECQKYIDKYIPGQCNIIIGSSIEEIVKYYNQSRFLVHFSSIDSSPRAIFEALLCGCRCLLSGEWTESLNEWLKSPLVHTIDKYSSVSGILDLSADYKLAKSYKKKIGLINLFPGITEFMRENFQSTFTSEGAIGQSVVGKTTFKDMSNRYGKEIEKIRRSL